MIPAAESFREAIRTRLGVDPGLIAMDGNIHRFPTKQRGHDEAGWAIGYGDGLPAGAYGDWRSGITETWCAKPDAALTPEERQAKRERFAALAKAREDERRRAHNAAAEKAEAIWRNATRADESHPYLVAKGVRAHGVKQRGETLIVPLRRNGKLTSLQFIGPDGSKKFITGGEVAGAYHALGRPIDCLVIAEGFATGATIHEATGHPVAVAFNAGNLSAVARAMRAKFPDAKIIFAADDDHQTEGNPGLTKARAAAAEIGALVAVPPFDRTTDAKGSDWNDFTRGYGIDAMKAAFEKAITETTPLAAAEPLPLSPPVAKAQPYPARALGPVLAGAAESIAAKCQCAPALAAQSVLAVASLAAQRLADVRLPYGQTRPLSLFFVTVAGSGDRKSTADNEALIPVRMHESNLKDAYQHDHETWRIAHAAWAADSDEAGHAF